MAKSILNAKFLLLGSWLDGEAFRDGLTIKSAFATDDGKVIAAVYFLREHDVFTYVLMVADSSGRYRRFFAAEPLLTGRAAEAAVLEDLRIIESGIKPAPLVEPVNYGVDLFCPGLTDRPNQKFVNLRDSRASSGTREAMKEVARWYDDQDGNFVKDFQTTGYDSRLWELYLFAAFRELGFSIDKAKAVPDFRLSKGDRKVFIEAVTANPSGGKQFDITKMPPPAPDNFAHYIEHEMPQKFGSPLRSKVMKEYWKDPEIAEQPFMIAIADFHAPGSMTWSHTALSFYLYGVGVELRPNHPNYRKAKEKKLGDHVVGDKVVPTDFFGQDAHRHVSAIMFSNAATNAKFSRMGVLAGFGDPEVSLVRRGGLYDYTPGATEAMPFEINVEDPDYKENWSDELEIYHNPQALRPLGPALFPTLTHFYLQDGELIWHGPERRVLYSMTLVKEMKDAESRPDNGSEFGESEAVVPSSGDRESQSE